MRYRYIPLHVANDFVEEFHRHHGEAVGHKFSIAAIKNNAIVGVAIVGRPVARHYDDGTRAEILRLCTNGTRNACSFLYGACRKIAKKRGYSIIGTYILASENGSSLRAAGYKYHHTTQGGSWNSSKRPRLDRCPTTKKDYYVSKT